MPNYEITLPSGKKFRVENAPDKVTAMRTLLEQQGLRGNVQHPSQQYDQTVQELSQLSHPSAQQPPGYAGLEDLARSAGGAVKDVVQGTLALPGELQSLQNRLMGRMFGMTPEQAAAEDQRQRGVGLAPKTGAEMGFTPSYQPKSLAGETLKTGLTMAGNALSPGSWGARLARVAIPTAAEEGTRIATRGSEAEGWLPTVAGIAAAPLAAAAGPRAVPVPKALEKTAPTLAQVSSQEDLLHKTLRAQGITYSKQELAKKTAQIGQELNAKGFRGGSANAPGTMDLVDQLRIAGGPNAVAPNYDDLAAIRRAAQNLAVSSPAGLERGAAKVLWRGLDDFMENSPITSRTGITQQGANTLMKTARERSSRRIKAQEVSGMTEAGQEGYTSGASSGLANQFSAATRKFAKKGSRGYSPEEQAAMKMVHQGTRGERLAARLGASGFQTGKTAGRQSLVPFAGASLGAAAGSALLGPTFGIPLGIGAQQLGANALANLALRMQGRNAQRAMSTILAGKAAQRQAALKYATNRQALLDRIKASIGAVVAPKIGGLLGP